MMGFFSFPARFIAYACIDNMPSSIASHAERQSELIDRQENDYLWLLIAQQCEAQEQRMVAFDDTTSN